MGDSEIEIQNCGEALVTLILMMGQIQGTGLGFMFRCSVKCKDRICLRLQCGSSSNMRVGAGLSFRGMVRSG